MAALAVDQHQHLVGPQAAQAGWVDVIGAVGNGLVRGVEGRGQLAQRLVDFGLAGLANFEFGDDIDRGRRLNSSAHCPRADDDEFFAQGDGASIQGKINSRCLPDSDFDVLFGGLVADEGRL